MVRPEQGRRLARLAYACAFLVMLSSCAPRAPSGGRTVAISARRTSMPKTVPQIAKAPEPRAAPLESSPTLPSVFPKPIPTKAQQIILLVREGNLINESAGELVFSKNSLTRDARSGLYEDAILLGRLRRALKEAADIPNSIYDSATVRDARAVLRIDEALSAPAAARAIDAALMTPGVHAVRARIAG